MAGDKIRLHSDNAVVETLLMPLYARAEEARLPAPLLKDDRAVEWIAQIDHDPRRVKLQGHDHVSVIMRACEFDRRTKVFLAEHTAATVVHIGCGLDTRFERVDNGRVLWYDLDLPEVIALRRRLEAEADRRRYLGCSVLDDAWSAELAAPPGHAVLFLAEGVLPYLPERELKELFVRLATRFPGSELVCDALTPLMLRLDNLTLATSGVAARLHWSLRDGREPERWADGIELLDTWGYFDRPEPRLGVVQWVRFVPPLAKGTGIYHYRLGTSGRSAA